MTDVGQRATNPPKRRRMASTRGFRGNDFRHVEDGMEAPPAVGPLGGGIEIVGVRAAEWARGAFAAAMLFLAGGCFCGPVPDVVSEDTEPGPAQVEIAYLRAAEVQDWTAMRSLASVRRRGETLDVVARDWARRGGIDSIIVESEQIDPVFPNRAQVVVVVHLRDGLTDRLGAALVMEDGRWKVNE